MKNLRFIFLSTISATAFVLLSDNPFAGKITNPITGEHTYRGFWRTIISDEIARADQVAERVRLFLKFMPISHGFYKGGEQLGCYTKTFPFTGREVIVPLGCVI